MAQQIKLCGFVVALTMVWGVLAAIDQTQVCPRVQEDLATLRQQMGGSLPEYYQLREEVHELGLKSNLTFQALSQFVVNNWANVLGGMDAITTNKNERLFVLYAGVVIGETNFLSRISQIADSALSNKVSLAELRFYKTQCSISDHYAASSLIRRYQEPSISNLIMKLNAAGAYPQGVSEIFSGEAKELYLDAVHDGLIGP